MIQSKNRWAGKPLKQEVGHDYPQLYKRIIDELPDLIRQTPKTTTIKENKASLKLEELIQKLMSRVIIFLNSIS